MDDRSERGNTGDEWSIGQSRAAFWRCAAARRRRRRSERRCYCYHSLFEHNLRVYPAELAVTKLPHYKYKIGLRTRVLMCDGLFQEKGVL